MKYDKDCGLQEENVCIMTFQSVLLLCAHVSHRNDPRGVTGDFLRALTLLPFPGAPPFDKNKPCYDFSFLQRHMDIRLQKHTNKHTGCTLSVTHIQQFNYNYNTQPRTLTLTLIDTQIFTHKDIVTVRHRKDFVNPENSFSKKGPPP